VKILEGYGPTEATCVSGINPVRGERRVGSIGLRLPGQRMKAVLVDERGAFVRDCRTDEVGLLVVSSPNVFAGYRDPAQNEGLWLDCGDGRRWLNTGDLGRSDAEGYFWLTGRKKELIIRGGHNLDPSANRAAASPASGGGDRGGGGPPGAARGRAARGLRQAEAGNNCDRGRPTGLPRRADRRARRPAPPGPPGLRDPAHRRGQGVQARTPAPGSRERAGDGAPGRRNLLPDARGHAPPLQRNDGAGRARERCVGRAAREVLGRFALPFTLG